MVKKLLFLLLLIVSLCNKAQINLDFESVSPGSYSAIPGWTASAQSYTSNTNYCNNYSLSLNTTISIIQTPFLLGGGTPSVVPASPLGGSNVLRLNGSGLGIVGFQRVSQTITVTPSNKYFQYAYFANMLGGDHGNCCQCHYFKIYLTDCSSNIVPCGSVSVLPTTTLCPNTGTIGMITTTVNSIYTPNWIVRNIDLNAYLGMCVTINVEPGMCMPGGHFPDLFFDAKTAGNLIQSNGGNQNGNNYVVCNGGSTMLTAFPANTYTWSGPGGFSSNLQSIITSTSGTYTLATGNNNNCPGPTQTISVLFSSTPTVNISASSSTICTGMSVTLTTSGAGINTYSWNTGATTSSIVVTPSVSSVYTVTANSGTCPATATVAVQVSGCAGIQRNIAEAASGFKIYPNPNKGNFTVQLDREEMLYIYDQLGKLVREIRLNQGNNFSVNLSGFGEGIYLLTNKVSSRRIVVTE